MLHLYNDMVLGEHDMKVEIFSKFAALNLIRNNFPDNTAVLSKRVR